MKNQIILISGPGGSGKTTIAELIASNKNFVLLCGDMEDTEFFPNGGQWDPLNEDKIIKSHDKILKKAKELFDAGNNVVLPYIIFDRFLEFFDKFKKEFGDSLKIVILFPDKNIIIKRDKDRSCWTTGEEHISIIYDKLKRLKKQIGKEYYIDSSNQTPEETMKAIFAMK